MTVKDDGAAPSTFELERFDWAGPDRLEIVGTFAALPARIAEPLLVVNGETGPHKLAPVADTAEPPQAGMRWHAEFAWQEPPDAFTTAELRLGDVLVELPGMRRDGEPVQALAIRGGGVADEDARAPGPTARLHLEAELRATDERARMAEREYARALADLERMQVDLAAERAGRKEDAARFREGLAAVEHAAAEELEQARAHLEAAVAARAQTEQLRAELEAADARTEQLRGELESADARTEQLRADLQAADAREAALRQRLDAVAVDAEEALTRLLSSIREAPAPRADGDVGRL
jgi:predicted RNase H-like nuclease (RuvC/YqgF family)